MAKKPTLLEKLKLSELSLVDRGANQHAAVTIMKNAEADELCEQIVKYYDGSSGAKEFKELLIDNKKQKQLWESREELYPLFNALQDSISSIVSDINISDSSRQLKIESSVNDFLQAVRDIMPDIEEELQKVFEDLNKAGSSGDINPDEVTMSEELTKKVAELEKALVEKTEALEKAAKEMADMKAMEEKKKKEMEMKKNDETVEVSGQKISKSAVGEETFAVFKAQAEQIAKAEERIAKAEEAAEMARLEKRATEEFKHIPGTATDIAKMLKAIGGMDEEIAKSFEAVMKVADEKNAEAFKVHGVSKGALEGSAEETVNKLAAEIQKRDGVNKFVAVAKVWEEHPELYAQYEKETA